MSGVKDFIMGPDIPDVPEAKQPAVPAPSSKQDTGAQVSVGSGSDKRNKSKSTTKPRKSSTDLSNLGAGGLNI